MSEPEKTIETVGSTTRTKTDSYDAAGRLKTSAVSSTVGTALPIVTDEYNSETGALEKQCANEGKSCTEGKPKTITSVTNKLGQLESYTDAAETENKTMYEYDIDGRIKKIKGEKGTETYKYSEMTGVLEELLNEYGTSKLAFTATYDGEGNMLTEGYPNGMTGKYTYNTVGKPIGLEYKKETHCTEEEKEKCKWFKDNVVPSIHGQWIEQASTLSHQTYAYDNAGRLTEVQNTPTASKNCTVRVYAYDEDSNCVSLTTRQPGTEGKCATEGGQGQGYTYDTADRLNEPSITYNTFGDITALPAQNSEDPELSSAYYADDQIQSQKQNKQTISYTLDPAGRTLEADATGEPVSANILSHFTGPSNTPAWTVNTSTKAWKRNIAGIGGSLIAIQNEGQTPCSSLPTSTATSLPPPPSPKLLPNSHPKPTPASSASRPSAIRKSTPGLARWAPHRTALRGGGNGCPLLRSPARSLPTARPYPRRVRQRLQLHVRRPRQHQRSVRRLR